MQFSIETVRAVARLLNEASLAEISIENVQPGQEGENRLVMRRPISARGRRNRPTADISSTPQTTPPTVAPVAETGKNATTAQTITANAVGLFRHAKTPVRIGDEMKTGQVVGVLEVLNVRNEIKTSKAGHVTQILVEDGQGVEFGQPLFTLEDEPPAPVDSGDAEEA